MNIPNNSLVKVAELPKGYEGEGETLLYLGEIQNMPGHCIVVKDGEVLYGYHTECFRIPTDSEI